MASANVMLMAASVRYQRPAAAPWWSLRETASGTGVAGSVSGALDPPGCVTDPHWYTVQTGLRTQHAGEVYVRRLYAPRRRAHARAYETQLELLKRPTDAPRAGAETITGDSAQVVRMSCHMLIHDRSICQCLLS
eukprot:COSAG02_NODE_1290_length_13442_cov_6.479125_6_plen_135_part_00